MLLPAIVVRQPSRWPPTIPVPAIAHIGTDGRLTGHGGRSHNCRKTVSPNHEGRSREAWAMRAVQVSTYGKPVALTEVAEPVIVDPDDVIVRIAGAGVCRTDLHIVQGGLAD